MAEQPQHILGYNQMSQDLRDRVVALKRDEQAVYQVLGLTTGRQVSTTAEGFDTVENVAMYPNTFVPATCVIGDAVNGEIPIGYVSGYAPAVVGAINSTPTPIFGDDRSGCIKFAAGSSGMVILTSADRAKYEFMELCDWNETSVNPQRRKPDGGYLFRRLFMAKEATQEVLNEIEGGKTLALVTKLTLQQLQFSAPFLGIDSTKSQDEITLAMMRMVRAGDWKKVRDVLLDEVTNLTNLVNQAKEARLLIHDLSTGEWKRGDTMDVLVMVSSGEDPLVGIMAYLQKNAKGIELRSALEKRLAPADGTDAGGKRRSKKASSKPVDNFLNSRDDRSPAPAAPDEEGDDEEDDFEDDSPPPGARAGDTSDL